MEIVGAIVTKIVEQLIEPIGRQFGYILCYKRNINGLRDAVLKLKDDRVRVQGMVNAAECKGEIILPNVQRWLREVDGIAEASEPFLNDETCQINKSCFNGLCPDLKWRYQIGKKAVKKTSEVVSLRPESNFKKVSSPAPLPSIGSNFPGDFVVFESRKKAFHQIMEALKDDKIKVIGIYGMGGIGKTTFAKDVTRKAEEDKLFDRIVMAEVSQTPNPIKIQDEIAERLGFPLNETSVSLRADRLCERLRQNKILVILDDLWTRPDLEVIGIPCSNIHKGSKLLMTSRNRYVYDEMNTNLYISLEDLHPTEAWNLFRNMAGDDVDKPDLHSIATEVAKECAGLPLAIVTVAKALRCKGNHVWSDALLKLRNPTPRNFKEMNAKVYSSLDLSYKSLDDEEMKYMFLLCCLFPEDSYIRIQDLLIYAMGLRLFDNVHTVKESEDRVCTLVDGLKARCLLLDRGWKGDIRVHGVIRDFGILVASTGDQREFLLTINAGVIGWSENDSAPPISLTHNNIYELPDRLDLDFPKLRLLRLNCDGKYPNPFKNPGTFFEGMTELQVLHMLKTTLPTLPPSLPSLKNLRTLRLEDCKVRDISVVRELKSLEILSICRSNTEELPKEIGQLTRLRLLEVVSSCNIVNTMGWMPSDRAFPVLEKLVLSELENLKEIWPGHLPIGSCSKLSELTLWKLPELINLQKDTTAGHACLHKLRFVNVQFCGKLKSIFSHHVAVDLGQLHQLSIASCPNLEEIFANDREGETAPVKDEIVLTNLEVLHLWDLPKINTQQPILNKKLRVPNLKELSIQWLDNLKEIWDNQLPAGSFNQLRVLKVDGCENLLKVVPSNLLPWLQNLEELYVERCSLVEEILEVEERLRDVKKDDYGVDVLLVLPQLRKLKLSDLPELVEMWWNKDFHGMFLVCPNLSSLEIIRCDGLKNIFLRPSISFKQFVHLEELHISDCSTMEVVVAKGEEDEGEVLILFSHVRTLKLTDLPHVRGFYLGNLTLEWPSLENVKVVGCPNMHTFSSMLPITPKLKAIELEGKLLWKGDLNSCLQHLFRVENWLTTIDERNGDLKLTEISEPSQCRSLKLPGDSRVTKISRLIYTNCNWGGDGILALASNAIHLLWKWNIGDQATTATGASLQSWDPSSGILMTNDVTDIIPEEAVPCFALSKNDDYLLSVSGGRISKFNIYTDMIEETITDPPPPPATFLAFHPRRQYIIAIGMSDSTILIYNFRWHKFVKNLGGHSQRITGLTFSIDLNVLVSSGADAKLCVWTCDPEWEMQNSALLQFSPCRTSSMQSDTLVQFNKAQTEFLVVHETHLAIYEPTNLKCVKKWVPCDTAALISHATFSCNSRLVYASFFDATVCVFNATNLLPRCRINASAYLSPNVSNSNVQPLVIAAHPKQQNQFALGLSDGGVYVIEPLDYEDSSTSNVIATPSIEVLQA